MCCSVLVCSVLSCDVLSCNVMCCSVMLCSILSFRQKHEAAGTTEGLGGPGDLAAAVCGVGGPGGLFIKSNNANLSGGEQLCSVLVWSVLDDLSSYVLLCSVV